MSLDPAPLIVSLLIGSVGLGLFIYGKRQSRFVHLFVGIALMVFPYFVPSVLWMVVIAAVLVSLPWLASRSGG